MTSSINNKNIDKSEWIQWIEDGISKRYINYHEYDEFQNIQHTGSGAFGNVYRANWESSNTVVALKSFRSDGCIMKEIVNELQLLNLVHFHANIIRFFGISKRKNNNDNIDIDYLFILEYADSGTLKDYLKNNFNRLDWNIKLQFAIQIVDAVSCIHQKGIIHRDLDSGNILIHQNTIKLADFGLSRRLNEVSDTNKYILGKIPYIDPQHFKRKRANKKSDVYSVGVLLWEISSGKKPFESYDGFPEALLHAILKGERETPISDTPIDYIDIYKGCWHDNPDNRPDMQQVLSALKLINLNTVQINLGEIQRRYPRGLINRRACQKCRDLKLKCDGDAENNVPCSNCDDGTCVYNNSPRKNRQVEKLKTTIENLEKNLVERQVILELIQMDRNKKTEEYNSNMDIVKMEKQILNTLFDCNLYTRHPIVFNQLRQILNESRCWQVLLPDIHKLLICLSRSQDDNINNRIIAILESIIENTMNYCNQNNSFNPSVPSFRFIEEVRIFVSQLFNTEKSPGTVFVNLARNASLTSNF